MPDDSAGIISRDDLNWLVDLFVQYDGALDPLCAECQDAEYQFNALVENLHSEKVLPVKPSISLSDFRCHARRTCRLIISKQGPWYPCINPEANPAGPFKDDDP
jgi:hypothetical protein